MAKKNYDYSVNLDPKTEKLFKEAVYLGQGNNGIVYELEKGNIIKIFVDKKLCDAEANTLKKTKKSKYFPNIHFHGELYIIREKVEGERLDKYIKRRGLTREITHKMYKLLCEFKKLKFKKIDFRCRDIYVGKDLKLMMIDPKGCYTRKVDFPRHLMKKLNSLGVIDEFLDYIEEISPKDRVMWETSMKKYLKQKNIGYNSNRE